MHEENFKGERGEKATKKLRIEGLTQYLQQEYQQQQQIPGDKGKYDHHFIWPESLH